MRIGEIIKALCIGACLMGSGVIGQQTPQLALPLLSTNHEALLGVAAPTGQSIRIEASSDLATWTGLNTFLATASNSYTDSAAPFLPQRFYRVGKAETNALTGDHLVTSDGEATIHAINHATFVLGWNGKTIYFDPVGGAARFQG